jgi:hypothetical protein
MENIAAGKLIYVIAHPDMIESLNHNRDYVNEKEEHK